MIYELSHNSPFERSWTIATSIHPRSRVIAWRCPDCGAIDNHPSGSFDVTVEGGDAFPDLLGCGAYPFLIVSERVVNAWMHAANTLFMKYDVHVTTTIDTKLKSEDAPPYYRVDVVGIAKVDIVNSGGIFNKHCPRCGTLRTSPTLIRNFAFFDRSWDGSSLFRDVQLYPCVVFCTDAIVKMTERESFTNFRFREMTPPDSL